MLSLAVSCVVASLASVAHGAGWDGSRYAWYSSDAAGDWHNAMPIGNGRLGALVFGSLNEKLTLNENSVWSGGWQDRVNPKSNKAVVDKTRDMLIARNYTVAGEYALANMAGNPTSPRAYQPLVDLGLDFGHSTAGVSNYARWLDTLEGTAGVNYTYGGVTYTREYVASYPHGVLAFRLSASKAGSLNVKLSLNRTQWVLAQGAAVGDNAKSGVHALTLSANSGQATGALTFGSEARIVHSGGESNSRHVGTGAPRLTF